MATVPKAEILKMADLAAYQDGAVVSRQITKVDSGNVTLFAFDCKRCLQLPRITLSQKAVEHLPTGFSLVQPQPILCWPGCQPVASLAE